jgi:integrase
MTVRKFTRRGKSRWIIEIPYRHRLTGKRIRFRKDADMQTSAAAHAEERRLIAEYEQFGFIRRVKDKQKEATSAPAGTLMTFKQAYEHFMETKAVTRLKFTTRRSYEAATKVYLLPRWENVKLADLGYTDFERLDADLKKAGLKPTSRANIMNAGRSVLRCCVESGLLRDMPRLPRLPKGGETIDHPPSAEDVGAILKAAPLHVRRALALCTDAGLRAGEVRGLEWQDVDLQARVLTVRQTIYHGQKDTPKSGHERQVPLTNRLYELLSEAAKKPHRLTDPVAPNGRGTVWGEPSLLHAFQSVLAKLGMPKARVHDLRHHFVTEAFRAGGGAPTVRDLAGHKHMHVTARYAHSDDEAKRAIIAALDKRHVS